MLEYDDAIYTVDYFADYDITTTTPSNTSNQSNLDTTLNSRDEGLAKIEVAVQAVIFVLALIGNACVLIALK